MNRELVIVWDVWRAESLLLFGAAGELRACGASGELRACYFLGRLES